MDANTHPDAQLIADLGGPTKVAELLGYDKARGGVQRVQNWLTRGIPAAVKVERPDLFLRTAGNDAPLLWMLHARGYDLHSLRKRETELERDLRLAREENAALSRVLQGHAA